MGEVRIVTLDPERWAEFRELRLQALRGDPTAFGSSYEESVEEPEAFWRGRLEDAQRKVENITLFAEADGRLVGMMGMFRRFRIKTKHVATVFGVYVDPAARGRGIARQLMQALLDEIACLPEIVKLELTVNTENPVALRLYRHFGFEIVGTVHLGLKIGERYYDEYLMEKLL